MNDTKCQLLNFNNKISCSPLKNLKFDMREKNQKSLLYHKQILIKGTENTEIYNFSHKNNNLLHW